MFLMKEVPPREVIEAFARRYPNLEPSSVEAFLRLLRTSTTLFEALEAHFSRNGISQGRFAVMMNIRRAADGKLTPAELADKIGCTRATITGLLDGLSKQGYLERQPHPRDKRKCYVTLTDDGQTFLKNMLPDHFRRIASLMTDLSEEERTTLVNLLCRVENGLTALREA